MTRLLSILMILTLLCLSIDGAMDIAQAAHSHEDPVSQQRDNTLHPLDMAKLKQTDHGPSSVSDHCEHCCHGHTSVVVAGALSPPHDCLSGRHFAYVQPFPGNFTQAPPTPPPNA